MNTVQVTKRDGRYTRQRRLYCSRELLERLSAKWTMSVIEALAMVPDKCLRFSELKSCLPGISARMLTSTLKSLERDGLLFRQSDRDHPRRNGYGLSPMGASMLLTIEGFISFTMSQRPGIEASRRAYDNSAEPVRARATSRSSAPIGSQGQPKAHDRKDRRAK